MQGVLPDASAFLVSGLPSRRWYSEATLIEGGDRHGPAAGHSEVGDPWKSSLPPKAREALAVLTALTGQRLPTGAGIRLESNIPRGKGLSSSSADVLSVLSLANDFLGTGLSAGELYQVAARVEPTDPVLSEDILVFYQHSGRRGAIIELPPVTLLYFDTAPGSQIETVNVQPHWPEWAGKYFFFLLRRLTHAARAADYDLLFHTITSSAEYNQTILPLPGFAEYYRLATETGTALMIAHSGTIAGLLMRPDQESELRPRLEAMGLPIFTEYYSSPNHPNKWRAFPAR